MQSHRRSFARTNQEARVYTVSEITHEVKAAIERAIPQIWLKGEVSSVKTSQAGHIYFNLKDRYAQLNAVIWRSTASRLRFQIENGLELLVNGRLDVYPPQGSYQIIIDQAQPRGVGDLQVAFEQMKEKLGKAGLFDEFHKQNLPPLPTRIGVVTSPTGAAIRDILTVLERRFPAVEILLNPAQVQGHGASHQIANAIRQLNAMGGIDLLIVGRGGGSMEDLWAFNEEVLAWAIYESDIPVVSAVGHETDITIADLVADHRAPTPTAAAEIAVPDRTEILQRLEDFQGVFRRALQNRLDVDRLRLKACSESYAMRQPVELVRQKQQRLDELIERLGLRMRERVTHARDELHRLAGMLDTLSPLRVMQRGYSVARRQDGTVIQQTEDTAPGELMETILSKGRIKSRVESLENAEHA
ncbi:MAG: exodeoxyribonuclease VII large subunit [Planctomycetota bacterium]|jgi:exodeoxyribonuclease VII large subunit|nr:exodeoxyribonuclease VII large subunit [Planctomycetota bacterium]